MAKSRDRLTHALHNEAVCDYLELKQEFSDWVITTAFYSALQFVSYRVFPFVVPGIGSKKTKIESIDDYLRYKGISNNKSKHQLLADLVAQKISAVADDYEWLLSMSMTARYNNYSQDKEIARKARTLLKIIKTECSK